MKRFRLSADGHSLLRRRFNFLGPLAPPLYEKITIPEFYSWVTDRAMVSNSYDNSGNFRAIIVQVRPRARVDDQPAFEVFEPSTMKFPDYLVELGNRVDEITSL